MPVDAVTLEQAQGAGAAGAARLQGAAASARTTARLSASATKLERLPSVQAFGDYGSSGTGLRQRAADAHVGISVRVPMFDGGRRDARRAESASQYRRRRCGPTT